MAMVSAVCWTRRTPSSFGQDFDVVHGRPGQIAQTRRTGVFVVHMRHQVGDFLDVLDSLDGFQRMDEHADVFLGGSESNVDGGHGWRSLRSDCTDSTAPFMNKRWCVAVAKAVTAWGPRSSIL